MKRSGFKRTTFERAARALPAPRPADWPRGVVVSAAGGAESVPKDELVRSEAYRRAVAALPCFACGVTGYSQAAHGDEGKGMAMKTTDLSCWPGCSERPGNNGCHHFVGRVMDREARRVFERRAAAETQATLIMQSRSDAKLRAVLVSVGLL